MASQIQIHYHIKTSSNYLQSCKYTKTMLSGIQSEEAHFIHGGRLHVGPMDYSLSLCFLVISITHLP